ncbi:hypothetical protein N6H18_18530 [Reichenbachiella agarivorans]|uniref:Lipocalin-like domain-containing protein n=1 Tax=Reichenbachiella agarivorans TaxID=2979464 RepID=A0ABY6CR72_9BACT|nr:hypothetical protein [Reichenbachiella agarivorans]UXP32339.1 hypothetical protein N6H18_18530 [Reichenbachiella agarivorans]
MKSIFAILILVMTMFMAEAQPKKVRAKDLAGTWQLKIDLGDDFLEEEMDDEDNALARVIMQATGSFVSGIIDELDIQFQFLDNGKCKITATAFGSDPEVEMGQWKINDKGQLIISDTDSFKSSENEYWMMEDDILIVMEDGEVISDDARVYMVRVD